MMAPRKKVILDGDTLSGSDEKITLIPVGPLCSQSGGDPH